MIDLLGTFAHLLGECPERSCQRWFVARRKGQEFCSRQCQMRAVMRAKRERERKHDTKRKGRLSQRMMRTRRPHASPR